MKDYVFDSIFRSEQDHGLPGVWSRADAIAVGVVIDRPLSDPADAALRLGAFAVEQDVEVIALSSLDYSGLERFGFRTEKVAGATPEERSACQEQLMQFWGIEVLIPT